MKVNLLLILFHLQNKFLLHSNFCELKCKKLLYYSRLSTIEIFLSLNISESIALACLVTNFFNINKRNGRIEHFNGMEEICKNSF